MMLHTLVEVTLAILFVLEAKSIGALSDAPSFFQDATGLTSFDPLPLMAPKSLSTTDELHRMQVQRVGQQRQLYAARQLDQGSSANVTTSSAANPDDVDQSVGLLNNAYYAPLNLSSNDAAQTVFVQLDTGSSDLWVVSSTCTSAQCATDRIYKFDESQSQSFSFLQLGQNVNFSGAGQDSASSVNVTVTAQAAQSTAGSSSQQQKRRLRTQQLFVDSSDYNSSASIPFSVVYDDGTAATGVLGQDTISFAHLSSNEQIFGLVDDTNVTLGRQGISGVLGMGVPRGSAIARSLIGSTTTATKSPLFTSLFDGHNSSYPFFALQLNTTGGSLSIGAVNPAILPSQNDRGLVEWHDVIPFPSGNTARASNATVNRDARALDSYLYWAVQLTAAGMNGSSVDLTATYGEQVANRSIALLDSGAPGIVGPIQAVDDLFAQIDGARHVGAGRYVVPCTMQTRMFFSFGARNYTLLPSDYIIGPAVGNPYLCLAWPAAVQGSSDGVDWILGQPFMRAQYTLFSLGIAGREPPKIGFYPLRAPADAVDASVVFAPQQLASVSAYVHSLVPIATTLPNSLVQPAYAQTTSPYVFVNATSTPSVGLLPSRVQTGLAIAPSTYQPLLTAPTGDVQLPVLVSTVEQLPVPSNPAQDQTPNGSPSPLIGPFNLLFFFCTLTSIAFVAIM